MFDKKSKITLTEKKMFLNLRISTAHSYNADFIVTDDQFKKALIKVYRNDKAQKKLSSNL